MCCFHTVRRCGTEGSKVEFERELDMSGYFVLCLP